MKAVIIEDEHFASKRLKNQLEDLNFDIDIIQILDSVESGIKWFKNNDLPDLIFLDIQLNDGYGFDILETIKEQPPIIFTTAYNEYAIRGFKYNGIDYLLKPIEKNELQKSLERFIKRPKPNQSYALPKLEDFKKLLIKEYKHRFIVKVGNYFKTYNIEDIAYFKSEEGTTCLITHNGKSFPIEYSIDQLEEIVNPLNYFRINRKYLIALDSVQEIHNYFNSRLLLKVLPHLYDKPIIVSRERCTAFKKWLDM